MGWWQRQFGDSTRGRIIALLRRGDRSVEELAATLGLTDNAVRAQLATLERDGVVHAAGVRRDGTVGKPATLYGVGPGTSSLFSSAYAPVLSSLVAELADRLPRRQLEAILRAAGRRLAPVLPKVESFEERVRAAAGFLLGLGADADLIETPDGYEIRAHGCVVADAVAACPATCRAVEALLAEATSATVRESCDRDGPPRCRFLITAPA